MALKDQSYNLSAPPVCQLARVVLGKTYAAQRGGTFDFWNNLSSEQRKLFKLAMNEAMRQAKILNLSVDQMIDDNTNEDVKMIDEKFEDLKGYWWIIIEGYDDPVIGEYTSGGWFVAGADTPIQPSKLGPRLTALV